MRIGSNPEKFNNKLVNSAYHRVVVPVYIPNQEGYFKDAFEIFKLTMESLLLTTHIKTRISIYNNNSMSEVKQYIDFLYDTNEKIDQVFHSKENLGKINAILACTKGNLESLITITDSDVLFKHGWQNAVEETFVNFPEAGMVSPVPSSKAYKGFTANNWYFGFFKGKLSFQNVKDPLAMQQFDDSLGKDISLYTKKHLEKYMVIERDNAKAVMGCGHFVATLKREVFDWGSFSPAYVKIQGGVENKFIDAPNEKLGFLRLATLDNFAYHMGNFKEEWMDVEFSKLKHSQANDIIESEKLFIIKPLATWKSNFGKLISRILLNKKVKRHYFKFIGLADGADY